MRITIVIHVLLALLLAPALASAGNADEYDTFDDATGWNTQRKLARDAEGTLYATYVVQDDAARGTEVVVARVESGALVETARPRAAQGNASRPSIAVDAGGSLWVAWTERAEDDREVFAARVAEGKLAGAQQLSGGLGYAGFPSLATDDAGHVHVAWYGFDGTFYQTFYREWDGRAWLPARQLSSGNLDANNPSVVVDAEGGVHVAWYKSDGHRYRIWYAHRPAGGDWTLPQGISKGEGEAFNGALAVDKAGRVHAAWDELHEEGYRVMHAVRGGDAWSAPRLVAQGEDAGEYPAIATDGARVLVAWAADDGRILGARVEGDAVGAVEPLFGNATGRLPALRGWSPQPAAERIDTLDALWTQVADGRAEVRVASYPRDAAAERGVPGAPWMLALLVAALSMRRR